MAVIPENIFAAEHKETFSKGMSRFITRFPRVFSRDLGLLDGELNLEVDKAVSRPTQVPARRVPVALKNALKAELDRLVNLKIISKVEEPTDWTSDIVVVHKSNGSLQICIDLNS